MKQTSMFTTVFLVVSVLVALDKPISASFIGKYQLADHPDSQRASLTDKNVEVSKGTMTHNRNGMSDVKNQQYVKATAIHSSNKPKKTTTVASPGQSSTRKDSIALTNGSCIAAPYRMTIRHAVSSTVTCSRRYEVKMCLGYCKSYTVPFGRQAKVNCYCCKGKTVLVNVPLNCDGRRVIKQVPTVRKCSCRPCSY